MSYNFEKMDWWKSKKVIPGLCDDVKHWVNKCEGPDDFYDNSPLDYLIGSIAIRDSKIGLELMYLIFNEISVANDLDETITNGISIFANPNETRANLVIEYHRLSALINQGQHTSIEKGLHHVIGWRLGYRKNTIVSIVTHHLQEFIPSMDSIVKLKVSKSKWKKMIGDTNEVMGLGRINDDD